MTQKKKTLADIIEEELKKFDAKTDAIVSKKVISKQYDKATKKLDAWEKKTFKGSGALGEIPGWFPQNDVIRLSVVREWLAKRWDEETRKFVKRYSLKDIRKMMVAFRKHKETNMPLTHYHSKSKTRNIAKPTLVPFPKEAYGPVSVVCHYDDTISAGPDEGLKKMHGNETAKAISEKKARLKYSKEGRAEIQNKKQERENEILELLTTLNSSRARKASDSQLIRKATAHFAGRKGFKEASIRRVWNKHFKKI